MTSYTHEATQRVSWVLAVTAAGNSSIGYTRRMAATPAAVPPLPAVKLNIKDVMKAINNQDAALKIGEGGFGQVYRGTFSNNPVAVKLLNIGKQRDAFEELSREVNAVGMIHHPNIVRLIGYAVSPEEGLFCIVYEYVGGGSFADALRKHKKGEALLRYEVQLWILQEVAEALVYVHALKAVHADIKPDNILLTADPLHVSSSPASALAKLCDFGFAKFITQVNAVTRTHTTVTRVGVSEGYTDPVTVKTGTLSAKTDVYSMVCFTCYMNITAAIRSIDCYCFC